LRAAAAAVGLTRLKARTSSIGHAGAAPRALPSRGRIFSPAALHVEPAVSSDGDAVVVVRNVMGPGRDPREPDTRGYATDCTEKSTRHDQKTPMATSLEPKRALARPPQTPEKTMSQVQPTQSPTAKTEAQAGSQTLAAEYTQTPATEDVAHYTGGWHVHGPGINWNGWTWGEVHPGSRGLYVATDRRRVHRDQVPRR
jgi:hypothetical protein